MPVVKMSVLEQERDYDPMQVFTYALKASESQRQYPKRFKVFLDYLKIEGDLEAQAKKLLSKAKKDTMWAQQSLMGFIMFQIDRANRGEIAKSTIKNYYKTKFLFNSLWDFTNMSSKYNMYSLGDYIFFYFVCSYYS